MALPLWRVVPAVALVAITAYAAPAAAAPPPNDAWTGAIPLTLNTTVQLDTRQATTDAVDKAVNADCGAPYTKASVWYRLTTSADRRVTVDVSGSDYSAGVIVTRGRPTNRDVVTCGPGSVGFRASAGVRYYLLAFSDTSRNGGHLVLRIERLAPATVDMEVAPDGAVNHDGIAFVSVKLRCAHADYVDGFTRLTQSFGHLKVRAFASLPSDLACDGRWHTAGFVFDSDTGLFGPGQTTFDAGFEACNDFGCRPLEVTGVDVRLRHTG